MGSEFCQIRDNLEKLPTKIFQTVAVNDNVRIVGDIAAGSAQMDDTRCLRRDLAVGIDMGHHIVAHFFFPGRGAFVVDIGDVRLQLGHLLCRNRQAQLHFRPCQRDP